MLDLGMQLDIRPLCDKCNQPMTLGSYAFSPGLSVDSNGQLSQAELARAYKCPEESCQRHYDILNGYFSISGGRIQAQSTPQTCQARHGRLMPMYIAEIKSKTSEIVWRCAFRNCDKTETTTGITS